MDISVLNTKNNTTKLLAMLAVVLAVLIILQAFAIYNAWQDAYSELNSLISRKTKQSAVPGPVKLNTILQANLFGKYIAPQTLDKLKSTTLNIKLVGLVVNKEAAKSSAIIVVDGVQKTYRVGDTIMDGAKISEITNDYVVLEQNGQQELLKYPHQDLSQELNQDPFKGIDFTSDQD